jgi:hypothetical protein
MKEKDIKEALAKLETLRKASYDMFSVNTSGEYKVRTIVEQSLYIFDRALFKNNDKVKLKRAPIIDQYNNWGWLGQKHFLVEGATAIVKERSFYGGKFRYLLEFDNESYVDVVTKLIQPVDSEKRGQYLFVEDYLELA